MSVAACVRTEQRISSQTAPWVTLENYFYHFLSLFAYQKLTSWALQRELENHGRTEESDISNAPLKGGSPAHWPSGACREPSEPRDSDQLRRKISVISLTFCLGGGRPVARGS